MHEAYGPRLQVTWKNFSLEEINKKQPPEWHVWDQPDDYPSRGLPGFRAAEAARRQGPEAYARMHWALLEGRHERRKDFREPQDIESLAKDAGLDLPRFGRDVQDRSLLAAVARDHTEAVTKHHVFGTPTFVFEDGGGPVFVRIKAHETAAEAVRAFEGFRALFVDHPNFDEIKRPHPPH